MANATQIEEGLDHKGEHNKEQIIFKRMNDINTFQCAEGDIFLRGTDEYGNCLQISFCAYDFIYHVINLSHRWLG